MSKEDETRRGASSDAEGLFIPAGLFIGMGIGWVYGHLAQGLFIGMGVGFACMALVRVLRERG